MNATDVIPAPHILAKTLGPWLIGVIADLVLMGAIIYMVSSYWSRYRDSDSWVYKTLVLMMFAFNLLKSYQACSVAWWKFVKHFSEYEKVTQTSPWEVNMDTTTAELCNFVSQLFFAIRLHRLIGGLGWVLVPLVPAMVLGFVGHLMMTIKGFGMTTSEDITVFLRAMYMGLIGVLAADVIITLSTSWYLLHSRTGYTRTDNLILRILHSTWVTAAFPSLAQFFQLLLYLTLVPKGNQIFLLFSYVGPKLYGVSMMYTLNSRQSMRGVEHSYSMNSRGQRETGGISVTRDIVRVTDNAETHPTSIKFAKAAMKKSMSQRADELNTETDTTKGLDLA